MAIFLAVIVKYCHHDKIVHVDRKGQIITTFCGKSITFKVLGMVPLK